MDTRPIHAPTPVLNESYSHILRLSYEEDEDDNQENDGGDSVMSDTDVGSMSDSSVLFSEYFANDSDSDFAEMDPPPTIVFQAARLLETEGISIDADNFLRLEERMHASLCEFGKIDERLFYESKTRTTTSPPPEGTAMAFLLKETVRLYIASRDEGDDLSEAELDQIKASLELVLDSFRYAQPGFSGTAGHGPSNVCEDDFDDQVTGTNEAQDCSPTRAGPSPRFPRNLGDAALRRHILEALLPADDSHEGEEADDGDDGNLNIVTAQEWYGLFRRLLDRGQAVTVENIGTALDLIQTDFQALGL
ncbi:hypothetical protein CPB85DRAFT_1324518 [Mucidula mucida]|nr:hypothetical protein CPB85DRAFT_1324518 [Mucidula mucida]